MPLKIYKIEESHGVNIPLVDSSVHAGFPSPAQDYIQDKLDINSIVISHPSTTFCAHVEGDCMIDANIHDGDIAVIDRSLEPHNGSMVVSFIDGEFTLRYIEITDKGIFLRSANPNYKKIKVEEGNDFMIWGVVTYTIHKH